MHWDGRTGESKRKLIFENLKFSSVKLVLLEMLWFFQLSQIKQIIFSLFSLFKMGKRRVTPFWGVLSFIYYLSLFFLMREESTSKKYIKWGTCNFNSTKPDFYPKLTFVISTKNRSFKKKISSLETFHRKIHWFLAASTSGS